TGQKNWPDTGGSSETSRATREPGCVCITRLFTELGSPRSQRAFYLTLTSPLALISRLSELSPVLSLYASFTCLAESDGIDPCQTYRTRSSPLGTFLISNEPSFLETAKYGLLKTKMCAFIQVWMLHCNSTGLAPSYFKNGYTIGFFSPFWIVS